MTSYRYKAMTSAGAVVRGTLDAESRAGALQRIRGFGHYPISASESGSEPWHRVLSVFGPLRARVPGRVILIAAQELASLLAAGIELERALEVLCGMSETKALAPALTRVLARVREGSSLADALGNADAFPRLFVSVARAGESSGNLAGALAQLAAYLERAQAIRDNVASALVYPVILLAMAGLSIAFILAFVLPTFEEMFADAGQTLPGPAGAVLALGHFARDTWWLWIFALLGALAWLRARLRKEAFRLAWDRRLLELPIVGSLLRKIEVERFCRTLALLLGHGTALQSALVTTRGTLSNRYMEKAVADIAAGLREGERLAARMKETGAFPAMTVDLIRVGEETGKLGEMLANQAGYYERDIAHGTARLVALIVPALTIVLGIIVGGLIATMLSAILSINELAL